MTVFRTATLRTFFFAIHAGAKELKLFDIDGNFNCKQAQLLSTHILETEKARHSVNFQKLRQKYFGYLQQSLIFTLCISF